MSYPPAPLQGKAWFNLSFRRRLESMEKRYQVFVSSTFKDLLESRQEVMQALLELDCIPAGMELFPAADDDQWTLIKRVIDDCDYYIVIIGGRYGSIGPEEKSFTQLEYEYAVEQGKPVIAFLHKEPGKLPAEDSEKDPENLKKLEAFRDLAQQKMVRFWTTPADLGSAVSRSIIKLIKSNPAVGWVKADALPSIETTEEILSLRKRIEVLQNELDELRSSAPKETEHLAQGDEEFEVHYGFGAYRSNWFTADNTFTDSFYSSWWQIFARISPLMIDEATDGDLRDEFNRMTRQVNIGKLEGHKDLKGYSLKDFKISEDDFNTIKVQLLALKLIEKSVKSRSVKDKANYWTLTPYGESVMTELRAIRREGYEAPAPRSSNKAVEADEP